MANAGASVAVISMVTVGLIVPWRASKVIVRSVMPRGCGSLADFSSALGSLQIARPALLQRRPPCRPVWTM